MTSETLATAKPTEIIPSASENVTGQPGSLAQLNVLSHDVVEHAANLVTKFYSAHQKA